ncbi:hypothetical protein [uncultured Flavobacterium sp.]|uniref:hypothetical protein n=1 Tax=uncultured Flavobacterium sp. TaxID=165435 RepID=UPI0030EF22EE|tara:strand:+ start:1528 stop:2880 length:1353 start_codon:yes stop_codon:yes gene_type:complete
MNINQKQIVQDSLEAIKSTDIEQHLIATYPTETDFSKINISKYSAAEFLFLFNKMITQLEEELENGLGFLLPFTENYANDFGAVNLQNDLSNIHSYLNSNQFTTIEPILDKLIHYQIKNGFWNKSEVKSHSVDLEELKKQKTLINLNQKALNKNLISYDVLKANLESTISDFKVFIDEKKLELTQITTLLSTANSQLTELNLVVSNATNKDTEIDGILKNIKDKVTTVSESITEYETDFTSIKKDNLALKLQLETSIATALEDLKKSKEGIEFVEGNREEIVRLTGMAADGALGSKFDQRQDKLEKGLVFWKNSVPGVTILSVIWVLVVFTCLKANTGDVWINLLINLLKTSPVFILMGFVFSQYKKERNLQEEYAFKSAVAMTLTAYSEMLSNADREDNTSRQQMLLKSIELVYNQPKIHPDKSETLFSFNTKNLKETVGTLTDALKKN